jgi:hypothetical protein
MSNTFLALTIPDYRIIKNLDLPVVYMDGTGDWLKQVRGQTPILLPIDANGPGAVRIRALQDALIKRIIPQAWRIPAFKTDRQELSFDAFYRYDMDIAETTLATLATDPVTGGAVEVKKPFMEEETPPKNLKNILENFPGSNIVSIDKNIEKAEVIDIPFDLIRRAKESIEEGRGELVSGQHSPDSTGLGIKPPEGGSVRSTRGLDGLDPDSLPKGGPPWGGQPVAAGVTEGASTTEGTEANGGLGGLTLLSTAVRIGKEQTTASSNTRSTLLEEGTTLASNSSTASSIISINTDKIEEGVIGGEGREDQDMHNDAQSGMIGLSRDALWDLKDRLSYGGFSVDQADYIADLIKEFSKEIVIPSIEKPGKYDMDKRITDLARQWALAQPGVFMASEGIRWADLASRNDKHQFTNALARFAKEGLIERYGNRRGCYRRRDDYCNQLDVLAANTKPVKIRWPLGVEKQVVIYPKNIIIIAGEPNSGKSAFLLNTAHDNQGLFPNHKVKYFSSEMGPQELRVRLDKFDGTLNDWTGVEFFERNGNFSDVIDPDGLNLIDYMQLTDNFWLISQYLNAIFDKLDNGLAVVAVQKKWGADMGRGQEFGLEIPRLYLAMGQGKLKIVKAKAWDVLNPNGKEITFKLVNGCKFIEQSHWRKEGED